MLHLYLGTDRDAARAAMLRAAKTVARGGGIVHVTDTHGVDDFRTVLQGGGMFTAARVVVFENIAGNDALAQLLLDALPTLQKSEEHFFLYEEKPNAQMKRTLERYAEDSRRYDRAAQEKDASIFTLSAALRKGDRKALWVNFRREIAKGKAPEAIHGVLFWGAKNLFLKSRAGSPERKKSEHLLAELSALPHEARRRGVELEYALEVYLLSEK